MDDKVKRNLVNIALNNLKNSYAPYSGFNVSACVMTSTGKIFTGVNVENASYPAGICAERAACYSAIASGERKIEAIAIVGGKNFKADDFCPPCGICRQVLREFSSPSELIIILGTADGRMKEFTLEELLPESFGPEML